MYLKDIGNVWLDVDMGSMERDYEKYGMSMLQMVTDLEDKFGKKGIDIIVRDVIREKWVENFGG